MLIRGIFFKEMLDKFDVLICLVTTELQSFAAARRIHPAHLVSNQEIFNLKLSW